VSGCCENEANDRVFTTRTAQRAARRFQRDGLTADERAAVDPLVASGVTGRTILEVGGGVGQLGLALLQAGATSVTNVELSPAYELAARLLATETGHDAARIHRIVGDATAPSVQMGTADIGVLFRVLCCTTRWREMLTAVAHTGVDTISLTIPRATWRARGVSLLDTIAHRLRGRRFTLHVHPHDAVLEHLAGDGFTLVCDGGGWFWRTLTLTR
jgi:hypothetical protein